MADNTQLNTGTGGDTVRSIDRLVDSGAQSSAGPKTQVVAIDMGGAGGNTEYIPNALPVEDRNTALLAQLQAANLTLQILQAQQGNGFYPTETGIFGGF